MVERLVTMEGILPITHSTVGRKPSNDKKKAPDWGFFIFKYNFSVRLIMK